MITNKFIENCLFYFNVLSLDYKIPLNEETLTKTFAKELYSDSGYFVLGITAYSFLKKHIKKVNTAMLDPRWDVACQYFEANTKKTKIKIKDKSYSLLTNIFDGDFEMVSIDENNNPVFEKMRRSDIHSSKRDGQKYKTYYDEDSGVTYIFEKEYFKQNKHNLDVDEAIGFYESLIYKDKYLYYVYPNYDASKYVALNDIVKLETLKKVTALIAMQTVINTAMITSPIKRY